MNHFCKTFFTVFFTVLTAAMVLLSWGFVQQLMTLGLF